MTVRVVCGEIMGTKGPVTDIVTDPEYLDVTMPRRSEFIHPTKPGHTVFAYVIGGEGYFCREKDPFTYEMEGANYFDMERKPNIGNNSLVVFGDGEQVAVSTEEEGASLLAHLRKTDRRAGCLVWTNRDEHQGGIADRLRRVSKGCFREVSRQEIGGRDACSAPS